MPTYEYKCDACGHQFERRQKMADAPVRKCPECGKAVRRLISAVAGIVHGSGPAPACDSDNPCCGRESTCDRRSCEPLRG